MSSTQTSEDPVQALCVERLLDKARQLRHDHYLDLGTQQLKAEQLQEADPARLKR